MGKKSGEKVKEEKARAFVLKVAMHCSCDGCIDKIRAAVKDITLLQGIESWDQSALESKGELRLVATADPEKLRHRLHKATRKNVDLIFPKDKEANNKAKDAATAAAQTQAQAQALLLGSHHQYGQNAWANRLLAGGGWNTHGGYSAAAAYPSWAVQQPDPYAAYSSGGASWGAYPPAAQGHGGAYGWHAHGY